MKHDEELDDLLEGLEPPYESPEHARIGRVLDRYGIPFFYRQSTLVYDRDKHRIWHPDFTLPGYNGLIVEYLSPARQADYAVAAQRKHETYAANQIPAVFVSTLDLSSPAWPYRFLERVRRVGQESCAPHLYPVRQAGYRR